jgi:hypothetical protein
MRDIRPCAMRRVLLAPTFRRASSIRMTWIARVAQFGRSRCGRSRTRTASPIAKWPKQALCQSDQLLTKKSNDRIAFSYTKRKWP